MIYLSIRNKRLKELLLLLDKRRQLVTKSKLLKEVDPSLSFSPHRKEFIAIFYISIFFFFPTLFGSLFKLRATESYSTNEYEKYFLSKWPVSRENSFSKYSFLKWVSSWGFRNIRGKYAYALSPHPGANSHIVARIDPKQRKAKRKLTNLFVLYRLSVRCSYV